MNSSAAGNRIIIAISGKQLSGKDTLAKVLMEMIPGFTRIGLGDAIKSEYAKRNNLTVEEVEKNKHVHRPGLIQLGNEGRMLDNGHYWANKVLEFNGNIIIPDIRALEEFDILQKNGAIMVRVTSDRVNRTDRGAIVSENDPTECALDHINTWDVIIENNSDLNHLKQEAVKIVELIPQAVK